MEQNPKQVSSNLADCRVQTGPCPVNCPECFYNRDNAYYEDIYQPHIPTPEQVLYKIVRVNCGHDSNIQREAVIEQATKYDNYFFNTSVPNVDFPGPVVLTLNGRDEDLIIKPRAVKGPLDNLMFVRLRISTHNFESIRLANNETIYEWVDLQVPIILTFTSWFSRTPPHCAVNSTKTQAYRKGMCCYEWKVRHINEYWCPTTEFMSMVWRSLIDVYGRSINMCGSPTSNRCVDCRNCESYYWQTKKRLALGVEK